MQARETHAGSPRADRARRSLRRAGLIALLSVCALGVGLVLATGAADAGTLGAPPADLAAQAVQPDRLAEPSAPEPMMHRVVAGGVATLLFGTMISVVVVSWRSFREAVEAERKRTKE
ncbi:hypothetical protein [Amorphus sp. 3PC139-8]|uniref:hypothetical protein n=1 Tax=Amorphus sp. 3PC139-8 TaxID=2735676 RepID=UPI00345CFD0C